MMCMGFVHNWAGLMAVRHPPFFLSYAVLA
jgi:hypothetical protein